MIRYWYKSWSWSGLGEALDAIETRVVSAAAGFLALLASFAQRFGLCCSLEDLRRGSQ
jgi:hypothetical protein